MAKVEDIDTDSIDTDSESLKVSFKAKKGFDVKTGLAQFEDHAHLGGWSIEK